MSPQIHTKYPRKVHFFSKFQKLSQKSTLHISEYKNKLKICINYTKHTKLCCIFRQYYTKHLSFYIGGYSMNSRLSLHFTQNQRKIRNIIYSPLNKTDMLKTVCRVLHHAWLQESLFQMNKREEVQPRMKRLLPPPPSKPAEAQRPIPKRQPSKEPLVGKLHLHRLCFSRF